MNRHFSIEDTQMTDKPMRRWSMSLAIRKMNIDTTVGYQSLPTRITIIKETANDVLVRIWRNWNPYTLLVRR